MILLPVVSCVLLYRVFQRYMSSEGRFFSFLSGITVNTLAMLFLTEILSPANAVNTKVLAAGWSALVILEAFLLLCRRKAGGSGKVQQAKAISSGMAFLKKMSFLDAVIVIVAASAVYFSLNTVPYNWDSMTYHLSRIIHWASNGSAAHYACHDISQISDPTLAEFWGLHIYLLSGESDRLMNLLQTAAYIVSVLIVRKISGRIGCSRPLSSMAALIYAATPIVFGEAISTQVDVFSGLWLMIFAFYSLDFIRKEKKLEVNRSCLVRLILLGFAAGFSYDAKASSSIGVLIFALWIVLACIIRKDALTDIMKAAGVTVLSAAAVIIPELARNLRTFGSVAAKESSTGFLVPVFSLRYFIINCAENIAYNLRSSYFPVASFLDRAVNKLMYIMFGSTKTPAGLRSFSLGMDPLDMDLDRAINPQIMWLFVIAAAAGIICVISGAIRRKIINRTWESFYIEASVISILAFFTAVRWYRFVTRYECGYFALISPAIALLVQLVLKNRKELIYALIGIVFFTSMVQYVRLIQYHRDFLYDGGNRCEAYFKVRNEFYNFNYIAEETRKEEFHKIGFISSPDSYEYPFWRLFDGYQAEIKHVCVSNETAVYEDIAFIPDCIVLADVEPPERIDCHGQTYIPMKESGKLVLYGRE